MTIDTIQLLQSNLCEFSREIRRLKEMCSAKDAEIAELRIAKSIDPVAWVDRKFGGSCVGWHQTILPPDGTQLFASPQPLPTEEAIKSVIESMSRIYGNGAHHKMANAVLKLLKGRIVEWVAK